MFKALLGFKDIEVSGQMQVGTMQKQFEESFGTKIRVYKPTAEGKINTGKGSRPADAKSTLASNCPPNMKITSITIRKSHSVDEVEKAFADRMGLGVQIMLPDGNTFAPNSARLKDVAGLAK